MENLTAYELEGLTLKFLRENDPLFLTRSKNLKMEYPYQTQRQIGIRESREIPVSNLNNRQKRQCPNMEISYANDY